MITIDDKVEKVHPNLIPVHIHYSGEAKAAEYFTPSKVNGDEGTTEAYFRGCKLVGKPLDLSFDGYVVEKTGELIEVDAISGESLPSTNYRLVGQFKEMTVFGHDNLPAASQCTRVNEWKMVSDIIHG